MRETAVFGYTVAMVIAIITVAFGFCQLEAGRVDNAAYGTLIGLVSTALLWGMSNWIAKENVKI